MIKKIQEISKNYEALIMDIWGTIYDGYKLYPWVLDFLKDCKKQNKKIVFLTNASSQGLEVAQNMKNVALEPDLYYKIISSGDIFFQDYDADLKYKKMFLCGYLPWLQNQKNVTANYKEAEILIIGGRIPLSFDSEILKYCVERNIPAICTNPDIKLVGVPGDIPPGNLAKEYLDLGGKLEYYGKPYPRVYQKCLENLTGIEKSKICGIGDLKETDGLGAKNIGINCFIIDNIDGTLEQFC